MQDEELFAKYMTLLGELFDKKPSDMSVDIYWISLQDFDDAACEKAFQKALTECVFMPKPAELREFAQPKADAKVSQAKARYEIEQWLYSGAKYPASEIAQGAIKSYGGRERLEFTDFNDLKFLLNDLDERLGVMAHKQEILEIENPERMRKLAGLLRG